jgi:hypothetical protein
VEPGNTKHGPLLDDELRHESESLVRGAPVESRAQEDRVQQGPGDGEPEPDALLEGDALHDEVERRSELARHLQPSVFPARPDELVVSATELHSPPEILDELAALPDRLYANVAEVWEQLGGVRERRAHSVASPAPSPPARSAAPAPSSPPAPARRRFAFAFDSLFGVVDRVLGITPETAHVDVDGSTLLVRFGPWCVVTSRDNVVGAEISGPFRLVKVFGPPHLSLADRGLTFATNARRGVCIRFHHPVAGIEPLGVVRHPGLTVTVDDPEGLVDALSQPAG